MASIINITTGNNVSRKVVPTTTDTTIREFLDENGIDYSRGSMHLDGAPLGAGDFDKTFGDFNITSKAYLLNVVKADNA